MQFDETDEMWQPEGLIALTAFELATGAKISEDGAIPFVGIRLLGNGHTPGGSIDETDAVETRVVMRRDAALQLAKGILEACELPQAGGA